MLFEFDTDYIKQLADNKPITVDGVYDYDVLSIADEISTDVIEALNRNDAVLLVATRGCGKLELLNEYTRQLLEEDGKCICVCTNDELRKAIQNCIRKESFSVSIDNFISPEAWADKMAELELPYDHGKVCKKKYKQNNNFFNNKEYYRRARISKLMEKHKNNN